MLFLPPAIWHQAGSDTDSEQLLSDTSSKYIHMVGTKPPMALQSLYIEGTLQAPSTWWALQSPIGATHTHFGLFSYRYRDAS